MASGATFAKTAAVAAVKHDADCAVYGSYVNGTDCGHCDCDRNARIAIGIDAVRTEDEKHGQRIDGSCLCGAANGNKTHRDKMALAAFEAETRQ